MSVACRAALTRWKRHAFDFQSA